MGVAAVLLYGNHVTYTCWVEDGFHLEQNFYCGFNMLIEGEL